jgi:light-regulated signal transduction histidine kinase (bacteriophytochrome)
MRSDRLLLGMQKVFGHDLPNQMVVLQSLLQLMAEEESPRLSDDGREYVRRLQNATKRASDMVRFLKEMARLNALTPQSGTITLAALARELQGELQQLHSATRFEFDWHWIVPAILGDPRVYLQAILELCAGLLSPNSKRCRVSATSEQHGDAIELAFRLQEPKETAPPRCTMQTLEQRMEIVLAREWLALCGAGVELNLPAGAGTCFSIVVPNR